MAIEFYLKHHISAPSPAEQLLSPHSPYYELLSPYFKPENQDIANWQSSPYYRNPNYPEQLTHQASSGNMVRSKSEVLIDMILYTRRIPFRYECALELDNLIVYPDFTIRHPKTGKIFYWEHFGLMDDPNYTQNAYSKLQLYTSHNIIPTIQLITTYETKDHPLSILTVEQLVDTYFC